jgi:hypothetical protein
VRDRGSRRLQRMLDNSISHRCCLLWSACWASGALVSSGCGLFENK